MLSDLVALVVQLYADEVILLVHEFRRRRNNAHDPIIVLVQIGLLQREGDKDESGFTYGFSRVAFVANLINGEL